MISRSPYHDTPINHILLNPTIKLSKNFINVETFRIPSNQCITRMTIFFKGPLLHNFKSPKLCTHQQNIYNVYLIKKINTSTEITCSNMPINHSRLRHDCLTRHVIKHLDFALCFILLCYLYCFLIFFSLLEISH